MRKMLAFRRRVEAGATACTAGTDSDHRCNFHCQHCFSRYLATDAPRLTLDDVARLADQAHALGVWQWHLQGGEPLTWPDLDRVLAAIGPQRFHIMITTNGWLMTPERAAELAALGVDKISVSIDSADPGSTTPSGAARARGSARAGRCSWRATRGCRPT
jgi:MoaA/NifB/PqqE/SkfB family radical SAM enzyme